MIDNNDIGIKNIEFKDIKGYRKIKITVENDSFYSIWVSKKANKSQFKNALQDLVNRMGFVYQHPENKYSNFNCTFYEGSLYYLFQLELPTLPGGEHTVNITNLLRVANHMESSGALIDSKTDLEVVETHDNPDTVRGGFHFNAALNK